LRRLERGNLLLKRVQLLPQQRDLRSQIGLWILRERRRGKQDRRKYGDSRTGLPDRMKHD
jgi:hypothetical protein